MLPNVRGLKIGMLNINGLLSHIDQLRFLMTDIQFDILAINESKIDNSCSNGLVSIPGYSLVRKDRNADGGGVAFYIREGISYTIRNDLVKERLELLVVEIIKPHSRPLLVSTWYRPPNSPAEVFAEFENFLKTVEAMDRECIVLGDINVNLAEGSLDPRATHVQFFYDAYQYTQLIKDCTRITDKSKTLIDHLITNDPQNIKAAGIIPVCISDHYLIYGIRKFPSLKSKTKYITSRCMKNYRVELISKELEEIPWETLGELSDPNEMVNFWEVSVRSVLDNHASIRKRKVKNRPCPWLVPSINELMHKRDHLKKQYVLSKSADSWNAFKRARNKVNVAIKRAKRDYAAKEINSNVGDSRSTWKAVNHLLGHKSKISEITELVSGDTVIRDSEHISNAFNEHFVSIASKINQNIEPPLVAPEGYVKPCRTRFTLKTVTSSYVSQLLSKLAVSKAVGLDSISARFLRDTSSIIAEPLTTIFNKCITTGVFPDKWKEVRVSPIHKGNENNIADNFRPISILPVVAKVFERIIYHQLYSHLTNNSIITRFQSGFRSNHSTLTALINATEQWYKNMDCGNLNGVLFVDLSKAFDSVDHSILLRKLSLYGICDNAIGILKSYLQNRTQCCVVNNTISESKMINSGVPQGSILGPLLFLLYINDLPNCLEFSTPGMFADDTQLSVAATNLGELEQLLNRDITNLDIWLRANRLAANATKTLFMVIASNYKLNQLAFNPNIKLNQKTIRQVTKAKLLGVSIDAELSWASHINDIIIPKVLRGLRILRTFRGTLPTEQLVSLYNALILPHFDYCSIIWGNCGLVLKNKLQVLQNRAARIITNSPYEVRSYKILNKLGWDNLEHCTTL